MRPRRQRRGAAAGAAAAAVGAASGSCRRLGGAGSCRATMGRGSRGNRDRPLLGRPGAASEARAWGLPPPPRPFPGAGTVPSGPGASGLGPACPASGSRVSRSRNCSELPSAVRSRPSGLRTCATLRCSHCAAGETRASTELPLGVRTWYLVVLQRCDTSFFCVTAAVQK